MDGAVNTEVRVIKDRPILFGGELVRAILKGRKTQTRRTTGLDMVNVDPDAWALCHGVNPCEVYNKAQTAKVMGVAFWNESEKRNAFIYCPFGKQRDRLWVREIFIEFDGAPNGYAYRADYLGDAEMVEALSPWKPTIHMPRKASRILLEIVRIRVERLMDITERDAKREGVGRRGVGPDGKSWAFGFLRLWVKVYGAGAIEQNPWVWVVEFRKVEG